MFIQVGIIKNKLIYSVHSMGECCHDKYLRMPSSGMLRRVVLVRTDDSVERITSIIRRTNIGKLGTPIAVHRLLVTVNVPSL
jgi:hypothetical protein